MGALICLVLLGFGLSAGLGFAAWLLRGWKNNHLLLAVTTFGLSLGLLTLGMFWIAWLRPGTLGLPSTLLVSGGVMLSGLWLARGRWSGDRPAFGWRGTFTRRPEVAIPTLILVMIAAGILFNACYWTFVDWDALAIYAPLGKAIYQTGALPGGSLYAAYPLLVPLAYAYTHWIAGGINEHLARLVPALMAIGGIAAAAELAHEMRSRRAGLIAAVLVALTPIYDRWASSGYADVPVGFYLALSALFAYRWLSNRAWQDAVLTGLAAGLAMWTKNDALVLLVTLPLLVLSGLDRAPGREARGRNKVFLKQAALMAASALAIAGPWYVRNMVLNGGAVPPTAWIHQAERSIRSLAVLLIPANHFALPGWLFAVALLYAIVQAARARAHARTAWTVLVLYILPFFAAWWVVASYDVRFVVTLVPLLAVAAALFAEQVLAWIENRQLPANAKFLRWAGALVLLAMLPAALTKTVDGKRAILRDPWMDDVQKRRVRLGGIYDLALAINRLPENSRVVGVPALALYFVDTSRLAGLSQAIPELPVEDLECACDYAVYSFKLELPAWAAVQQPLFQSEDGYMLFAVDRNSSSRMPEAISRAALRTPAILGERSYVAG